MPFVLWAFCFVDFYQLLRYPFPCVFEYCLQGLSSQIDRGPESPVSVAASCWDIYNGGILRSDITWR